MTDFDQFVATNVDDLLRTAYLIVWEEAEAEDLVQECLLKVARRARPALLQRFDGGSGRRGSRLFAGDGQEQRLTRTRAAARGAAASFTPIQEHRDMSDLPENDLRDALADRATLISSEASARLRAVDYHPRSLPWPALGLWG
jgi:hypothetical protein